ncbi:MAG: hypothetical protein JWP84_3879 [Tardiphaga sp.]|nr:hypothetical protein [Tardiphaga sp.]
MGVCMNDEKSDIAAVLDRAGSVRASFGWIMGSWILLRAIGAADKKRSLIRLGVSASVTAAFLKLWLDR